MELYGKNSLLLRQLYLFLGLVAVLQQLNRLVHLVHLVLLIFSQRIRPHIELRRFTEFFRAAAGHVSHLLVNFVNRIAVFAPLRVERGHIVFLVVCFFEDCVSGGGMGLFHVHCFVYAVEDHHLLYRKPVIETQHLSILMEVFPRQNIRCFFNGLESAIRDSELGGEHTHGLELEQGSGGSSLGHP